MVEKIKLKFSVYAGVFQPSNLGKLEELYQSDDKASAISEAKRLCNEFDQIEVVNNITGESEWRGLRRTE